MCTVAMEMKAWTCYISCDSWIFHTKNKNLKSGSTTENSLRRWAAIRTSWLETWTEGRVFIEWVSGEPSPEVCWLDTEGNSEDRTTAFLCWIPPIWFLILRTELRIILPSGVNLWHKLIFISFSSFIHCVTVSLREAEPALCCQLLPADWRRWHTLQHSYQTLIRNKNNYFQDDEEQHHSRTFVTNQNSGSMWNQEETQNYQEGWPVQVRVLSVTQPPLPVSSLLPLI